MGNMDELRAQLDTDSDQLYLNTGGQAILPRAARDRMMQCAMIGNDLGPGSNSGYQFSASLHSDLKQLLAEFIGAPADELTLTTSTGEGLCLAAQALCLDKGDQIIVSDEEHAAGLRPWLRLASEVGVVVTVVPVDPLDTFADRVADNMSSATRVISLTHVSYLTGKVLPIADVCSVAGERGVFTVVDGAQSVGVLPVRMDELGCDAYAFPGQKWLLGPVGTGGLYVRRGAWSRLRAINVSEHSMAGEIGYPDSADRFGCARPGPLFAAALHSSCELLMQTGIVAVHERASSLVKLAAQGLKEIDGVEVWTPPQPVNAGLLSFKAGESAGEMRDRLEQAGVIVRVVKVRGEEILRASFHCYNDEEDVHRFVAACGELVG